VAAGEGGNPDMEALLIGFKPHADLICGLHRDPPPGHYSVFKLLAI